MNKVFLRSGEYTLEALNNIVEKFPNGMTSYLETYYEVVAEITNSINLGSTSKRVEETEATVGRGGLWMLAEDLADKFELQNKGREWDGEFFDEIDKFLEKELYEKV